MASLDENAVEGPLPYRALKTAAVGAVPEREALLERLHELRDVVHPPAHGGTLAVDDCVVAGIA